MSCHNSRSPQPANDPLNLEAASLDDPLKSAATWERVLRKLSVRAMPPAGVPRPEEREYAAFTSWLADSLDRAWAGRSTPGVYVIHRLNRAEYRNAIRDLLALDVDVATMLPNDGGDFGFDNIATALRTSPLLLDGYVTAAQRISTLAIGDPKAVAATAEYSINRNVSQNVRVDGLPLGTRGGTLVRHIFPADGEYKLSGRLVRGIEEGYAGVENDQPDTFVITIDGVEVFSAQIGGPEDHAAQAKSMNDIRPIIDARMTGSVRVTAGPHEVGFTFRERPFQAQDVWQPARRDSQEVHMTGGLPKLKTVGIEGPYKATGVSATAAAQTPSLLRHLELSGGIGVLGGATLGTQNADLRTATTGQPYRLFTSNSRMSAAPVIDLRLGTALTRRFGVEAHAVVGHPEVRTALSSDAEGAPSITAVERLDQERD